MTEMVSLFHRFFFTKKFPKLLWFNFYFPLFSQTQEDNVHYAALRDQKVNKSRRNRESHECVYASVNQWCCRCSYVSAFFQQTMRLRRTLSLQGHYGTRRSCLCFSFLRTVAKFSFLLSQFSFLYIYYIYFLFYFSFCPPFCQLSLFPPLHSLRPKSFLGRLWPLCCLQRPTFFIACPGGRTPTHAKHFIWTRKNGFDFFLFWFAIRLLTAFEDDSGKLLLA